MPFEIGEFAKRLSSVQIEHREQIEYIDIDRIDDDPRNFYELSGLDELAANIELLGLQQPIRVRDGDGDHVVIVSGHRRRAAIRKLVQDGRNDLREVPCIRERGQESETLQELRLIYANSDTRKMTSAELSRQAQRVEELLYKLKEEGFDFPGRMRDHVAQACKVSASKLARLKMIRENLHPSWKPSYESGELSESTAYTLAQMPAEHQTVIFDGIKQKDTQIRWFYEHQAKNYGEKLAAIDNLICKRGSRKDFPCSNIEGKRKQAVYQSQYYSSSSCSKCCDKCENLAKCKNACPMLADKVRKLRETAKAQRHQDQLAKEERERPVIEEIRKFWSRFGEARTKAGKSVKACYKAVGMYWVQTDNEKTVALEDGSAKITVNTNLPYGYGCSLESVKRFVQVADLLGVSLDYLLCRTDTPQTIAPTPPAEGGVPLQWLPGQQRPVAPTRAVCKFAIDGEDEEVEPVMMLARWNGSGWAFLPGGRPIEAECLEWWPVPEG